jgi:DNA polymerase III subunit alpha
MKTEYGDFVHLHLHTEYSLLDGVGKIDEYLSRAIELGMSSIAITDHGNMFGAVEFYKKAMKKGVKPIIGIEAYIAEKEATVKEGKNFHLILLAKNEIGYRNLVKISSFGYVNGFYYKPRADKKFLKEHSEGIIALSACMAGELSYYMLNDKPVEAQNSLNEYLDIFGKDNFYIELQDNGVEGQHELNEKLYKLAVDNGVEVVATNDVHYVYKGDDILQDILVCIQTGSKLNDPKRMRIDTEEIYLKSREQMSERLGKYKGAIENTVKIAKRCNLELEFGKFKFPHYIVPAGESSVESYIRTLVYQGMKKKYGETPSEEIIKRTEYELGVIINMGYSAYFIVVWDFINYSKQNNIPIGPGRGSAAGSMVAYLLGITDLDPIKYNLIFERFLNPERISMPDIDIDICQERRQEVIEYVSHKYGKEKVAQIITFGTMKARAAVRDVGRVMDIALVKVDKVAKLIPQNSDIKSAMEDVLEIQQLYSQDEEIRKILDYSKRLEGKVRHASIHAAGVVISKDDLDDEVPVYADSKTGLTATQYQMKELEELGILKMDFLGLRNLTIIQRALEYIEENRNIKIELDKIELDDIKSYNLLKKGDTLGVFQMESDGIRKLIMKLSPDRFEDIVALLALYRPGPLGSGMVDDFVNVKNGRAEIKYPHPSLEGILKETYGVILYQEQVMKIANVMANYSLGEADLLRRAMGKKNFEIMQENRNKFVEQSVLNGVEKDKAEEIFDLIDKFAGYGFNKSHSAAYALIAYWTAWLKANYKEEFFAALMTSERNNIEKLALYIDNSKKSGIEVAAPDVNISEPKFKVVGSRIVFGMSAIKNLGEGVAGKIVEERKTGGEYKDYEEFAYRVKKLGINKKGMEALVMSGALDSLEGNRREKYEVIDVVLDRAGKKINRENDIRLSLFGEGGVADPFTMPKIKEFNEELLLNGEKEYLGLYFSGHPLEKYRDFLDKFSLDTISEILETERQQIKTAGLITALNKKVTKTGKVMAEFLLEDYYNRIKVIVFPADYNRFAHNLIENMAVFIEGTVNIDSFGEVEEKKIIARELKNLDEIEEIPNLKVYILIEEHNLNKSEELKSLLMRHKGKDETYLGMKREEEITKIKLDKKYWVTPSKSLINDVISLLGEGTIKIR